MNQATESDTKTKILDAAERLFAGQGLGVTSLRQITAEAGVNLAAVNYHFRSKEELAGAVLERRLRPVNQKRLEMLDALEAQPHKGALPLEPLLEAFFRPALELNRDREHSFQPLIGRIYGEPGAVRKLFFEMMSEVSVRFSNALVQALPDLPRDELVWRLHFAVGALAHTMAAGEMLEKLSDGLCDLGDVEGATRRIVEFTSAGLRAGEGKRGGVR